MKIMGEDYGDELRREEFTEKGHCRRERQGRFPLLSALFFFVFTLATKVMSHNIL